MSSEIIKNSELLQENYQVANLLDIKSQLDKIRNHLDMSESKTLTAIIGDYGTGKSTALYNLSRSEEDAKWVWFDAWKYPDRNNLWEGFILDFARQVAPKDFNKVLGALDGTNANALQSLIKVIGQGSNLIVPSSGSVIDQLAFFARSSPAKRVFEMQAILLKLINKIVEQKIVVVVEDIDRSQDQGLYFLETLNNFLATNDFKAEIRILVPMSAEHFETEKVSYKKCLHYKLNFSPKLNTRKFLDELFSESAALSLSNIEGVTMAFDEVKSQISTYLDQIAVKSGLNFRDFKSFMRGWVVSLGQFENQHDIFDWRLHLCAYAVEFTRGSRLVAGQRLNESLHADFLAAVKFNKAEYLDQDGKAIHMLMYPIAIMGSGSEKLNRSFYEGRDNKSFETLTLIPKEYFTQD